MLGASLAPTAVLVAEIEVQLAAPHSHPLRQQFPPKLAAQLDQPVAQLPVGEASVAAGPKGTTIVSLPLTIVVEVAGGQSVTEQSLPVLQHPPAL
jgi:hypothetical protein